MSKPSIFIGSSTEGLKVAEAVFNYLVFTTKPKLWTNQLFLPGSYPMEVLEKQLKQSDFAILIASPDDKLEKRGYSSPAMRDNLLLEFGLFSGALGRKRAFFICPDKPELDLPSDLFGMIVAKYDSERIFGKSDEIAAAVQVACNQIKNIIEEEWEIIQKVRTDIAEKVRASEKGKIIERMNTVISQIHSTIMIVQRDAFSAVTDEISFDKVKYVAIDKVNEISSSFSEDANEIGLTSELSNLVKSTEIALEDLPFPRELSLGKEAARQKVVNTGFGALNTFLRGGDPFRHLENAVTEETGDRIECLKNRYMAWWEKHYPNIEEATFKLQSKLLNVALELAASKA